MGADLGVPLSDLRLLCVSVAGGVSRKTFTQFSKREKRENVKNLGVPLSDLRLLCGSIDGWGGESRNVHPKFYT